MNAFAAQTSLSKTLSLIPVDKDTATELGNILASMDPWKHYNYPAHKLTDFLNWTDPSTRQYAIMHEDKLAGTIAVRTPWLQGPYIQLLGLLPGFQGQGLGTQVLNWVANEARGNARNIWIVASEMNTRAISFYESHGYKRIAMLDDLVKEGMNEILFRRRL